MKREELRWMPKKPECEGGGHDFKTVGIAEIQPAVNLLLVGYALAVLLLVSEYLFRKGYDRCKNRSNKQFFKKGGKRTNKNRPKNWNKTPIITVLN